MQQRLPLRVKHVSVGARLGLDGQPVDAAVDVVDRLLKRCLVRMCDSFCAVSLSSDVRMMAGVRLGLAFLLCSRYYRY